MIPITTAAEAQAAIDAVTAWLATYQEPLTLDDLRRCEAELSDETFDAAVPYMLSNIGIEASTYLARHWSHALLNASAAWNQGCLLCGE